MTFIQCSEFEPSKNRVYGTGDFYVNVEGLKYSCSLSSSTEDHSLCALCKIPIRVRNETMEVERNVCYFYLEGEVITDYKALFGIPVSQKLVMPDKKKIPLKIGPIFCPYHDDRHKSACRYPDGNIYCFACKKVFK